MAEKATKITLVAALVAAAVALGATKAVPAYLRRKKNELLLVNKQKTNAELARYQVERDRFLRGILSGAIPVAKYREVEASYDGEDVQFVTPFDLVPGKLKQSTALSDYLHTLTASSDRSRAAVVETLLNQAQTMLGASVPLPLTWFMPKSMQQDHVDVRAVDVLHMLEILSPLQLATSADGKNFIRDIKAETEPKATDDVVEGDRPVMEEPEQKYGRLPASCTLDEAIAAFANDKVPGSDVPNPIPKPMKQRLLPGLCKGWAPHHKLETDSAHSRRNLAMAEVCNRLMFNAALKEDLPFPSAVPKTAFSVTLPDGSTVSSLEDLVTYLSSHGCEVKSWIRVAATVFGNAFSLRRLEDDGETQADVYDDVPFTLFARTSVYSDEVGAEAVVPLLHSGIQLSCRGMLDGKYPMDFEVQYYLSMGGVVGWNCRSGIQDHIPWNKGRITDEWESIDDIQRIIRLCTANTMVMQGFAEQKHLWAGGYGVTGVCSDSIATIQRIMNGSCSLYPLLALPRYRIEVARYALKLSAEVGDKDLAKDLQAYHKATLDLPSDIVLSSTSYTDSLRRMLASIPWKQGDCPFVSTELAYKVINSELAEQERTGYE